MHLTPLPPRPAPEARPHGPASLAASLARRAQDDDRPASAMRGSVALLARHGLLTAPLPPDLGGRSLGAAPRTAEEATGLLVAIGSADLSLARLYEGHLNALRLIVAHGTAAQRECAAALARAGGLLGVWGADGDIPVTLSGGTLAGGKRFCSGLGIVAAALVTARSGQGQQLVLTDATDPARADPAQWQAAGMRATFSGTYDLAGVAAPPANLIGPRDIYTAEPLFLGGVWRIAAAELGGTFGLLEAARSHLAARGRLGDPTQTARLGRCLIAAHSALRLAATAAGFAESPAARRDPARAADLSVMARLAAERAAEETLTAVAASAGLEGCTTGTALERRARDLSTYIRQINPDGLLQRTARSLLDDPRPLAEAFAHGG